VDAKTARELAHALHRGIAPLADDVGGPEIFSERDPVGMAPKHDDLFGA
jgi:hypothetical protein